jgi:hypothetical protein
MVSSQTMYLYLFIVMDLNIRPPTSLSREEVNQKVISVLNYVIERYAMKAWEEV